MIVDLCRSNGCRALLAQYRLAPEHKLPTGQIDGFNAYRHVIEELKQNPKQVFILGDSAGGNVALSTLLQARDARLPQPAGAMLLSPGTDLSLTCDSTIENMGKDPMFHMSTVIWMLKMALPTTQASNDPLVSPSLGDFTGIAPLLFEVGSTEILRDHSTLAADNAQKQGVDVEITVSPHSPHVYPIMKFLPEAVAARARIKTFIDRLRQDQVSTPR